MFKEYIRKKTLSILCICMMLIWAAPASAGWWELQATAGGGDSETVTAGLTVRYVFEPLYENNALELRPLAEGSGTFWKHNTDDDEWCAGVSGGLLLVFLRDGCWRPYLSGEFGAFLISDDEFAERDMGGLLQFRSKGALGVQFGTDFRHSIQIDAAHYSNGSIYDENKGFNTYGVTYGIRF